MSHAGMDSAGGHFARLDRFFSEFTTVKRAVIHSKSLRCPEIVVTLTLWLGVLGYKVVYKLNFLAEVPFAVTARAPFSPTYANWWRCETHAGTCQADIPAIANTSFCHKPQLQRYWNTTELDYLHRWNNIPCRIFDRATDQREVSGSLRIATRTVDVVEERVSHSSWAVLKTKEGRYRQNLLVGSEQLVELDGELPSAMGVQRLMGLQGFIKYEDEDFLRRIRCASKGEWLDSCPHDNGKYWARKYKAVSGSIDAPVPDFQYNSTGTGCVQVLGAHLFCHVTELLRAAGVDLDKERPNVSSRRVSGVTLEVKLKVENWNSNDFWSSPISLKPRFVIEVQSKGSGGGANMYSTYEHLPDMPAAVVFSKYTEGVVHQRRRRDHFGITLSLSSSTSWAEFSWMKLVGVVVVAMGVVRYANYFVTSILVAIYKWLGCVHVAALYEYNARQPSPKDTHIKRCNEPDEFRERHRAVEEEFLNALFHSEATDHEAPEAVERGVRALPCCRKVDQASLSSVSVSDSDSSA